MAGKGLQRYIGTLTGERALDVYTTAHFIGEILVPQLVADGLSFGFGQAMPFLYKIRHCLLVNVDMFDQASGKLSKFLIRGILCDGSRVRFGNLRRVIRDKNPDQGRHGSQRGNRECHERQS